LPAPVWPTKARAEHIVQVARIVADTRDQVAGTLPGVKGEALAQQAGVQLVSCVALHTAREELADHELRHIERCLRKAIADDGEREKQQRARVPFRAEDVVQRAPQVDRRLGADRAGDEDERRLRQG
jgi:hypothetical protein